MNDVNGRYKKPPARKKSAPVKRIVVSEDTQRAYEAVVRERDNRERTYGRHLDAENRGKR